MGILIFPIPSVASGKVMYRTMLTSGTSYTVPTGVTSLNVTLIGGGGGGPGANSAVTHGWAGLGGQIMNSIVTTSGGSVISYSIGAGGSSASGPGTGGTGGTTTFTGATSAEGGAGGSSYDGLASKSGITANNGGGASGYDGTSRNGGVGGSGAIIIEYWV